MLRTLKAFALVGGLLLGGLVAGAATTVSAVGKGRDPYAGLDTLARVLTDIELYWVDQIPTETLLHKAISGMVGALDAHSLYLDPETWARVQHGDQDALGNLGLELRPGEGATGLTVQSVVPEGPAARAGLVVGDRVVAVDGTDVRAWPVSDVAALLGGPVGEAVRLELVRGGASLTLTVVRDTVIAPAVEAALFAPGWGYARVLHFRQRVSSELKRALDALVAQGGQPLRGLVLDLRDNPGGVLEEAVGVADLFLRDGLIVETHGRVSANDERHEATSTPGDLGVPLVVLINRGSASASEIVAGALHDRRRATLVGARTYGKGSVQSVFTFSDGSALKLTIARYYLPNGETIADGQGLTPDVAVALDAPDAAADRMRASIRTLKVDAGARDQLLADLDTLTAGAAPPADPPVPWTGTLEQRLNQDRQLASAWRTVRGEATPR